MLTIKIVESKNCTETIFEARQVHKHLYEQPNGDIIGEVRIDPVDVEAVQITYHIWSGPSYQPSSQTIYVMNRYGATVGTYSLA